VTLKTFKNQLQVSILLLTFIIYSFGLFLLGRLSHNIDLAKFKKDRWENEVVQPVSTNAPYADSQSANVISSYVKLCANTVYSFEVSYPKDWFSTYNMENQKCTYFAPYSFVIAQNVDWPFVPIKIEAVAKEKWLETVKFHQNPNDFQNVFSSQNIQINDKSALKIKAETTGNGSLPRGLAILSYLIFDSRTPMILSYNQLDQQENTELFFDVLDQMANSLRFY